MKYAAFLRGINVGGKNIISMALLKQALEKSGFEDVFTFINSGNVIFSLNEKDTALIEQKIEKVLKENFFEIKTIVISQVDLKKVLDKVPQNWKSDNTIRKNIAFIKNPLKPEDVCKDILPKDEVDELDLGPGVLYMSTKLDKLVKSNFPKFASKPVYKEVTVRTYATVSKIYDLANNR